LKGTLALRAVAALVGTLCFFLEGEFALAQTPTEPAAPPAQPAPFWHVIVSYGQASAPRSQGFAEAATLSLAHDFRLFGVFKWGVELTPLFVVNQTRVDLPGRPRETVFAVAALPLLLFDAFPRSPVGFRLEGGVGVFYGFSPVPGEGSRLNFFDLFGARVKVRLSDRATLSGGLRRTHVSNLGLAGPDNPGLSFYSGVVGLSWPAR
jgi:Lipid A 3-O-deacylase (PagL)